MGLEDGDKGNVIGNGVALQQEHVGLKGMPAETSVGGSGSSSVVGVDNKSASPPSSRKSSEGPGPLDGSSLAAALHNQLSF